MPTVTIDGIKVDVQTEATILDAAHKAGIWIPTLCYNPSLPPLAACRICMVEVDRGEWRQLVTACNYPVRRDVTVYVSSEKAVRARRGVMELLLARSPDCEQLQTLAQQMGVEGTPYPTVTESQRNCILCGLCVSVCEEIIGCSAIGFTGRGVERTVATPFRLASEDCIACGVCAAICPVGTIQIRIHADTGEAEISPFKSRAKLLVCEACGTRMVTEPVGEYALRMLDKVKIDWADFRERARLCPECRRKQAAEAVGLVDVKPR
ncbi:2Fe-2S iron-sulfur cluster binding domain-containing protein [candidate division KSB3 bacterium]|uniref:2Fe-2S iron-sulfur cluster binding domain-containing protein n=1 Tax=candidate division KSB3 bacterium TaxID=2044937 RepID=A0A9D5JYX2_9BACT|nr:2Fe-2S iron-sulfur cluster binding domain-containing protein [candidate division KSB3 bacterium]MBD3326526.1 2Fe-2S iron-sulfur cluster binding domain-containing protein [candidate division KSB3 bacterium]